MYSITAKLNGTQVKNPIFKNSIFRLSISQYWLTTRGIVLEQRSKAISITRKWVGLFEHLEDGLIDVEIGKDYAYQIKVSDANNNNCYLFLPIKEKNKKLPYYPKKSLKEKRLSQIEIISSYDGAEVYISKNAVYDHNNFVLSFDKNELRIKADHVALRKALK